MNTAILQLKNLNCPSCYVKIKEALADTDGVKEVKTLLNAQKTVVEFDKQTVSEEKLTEIIHDLGYEAQIVKVV